MKKMFIVIAIVLVVLMVAIFVSKNKNIPAAIVYPHLDSATYIAQINSAGITREDYQKKLEQTKTFFSGSNQSTASAQALDKNVLNGMVDDSLVIQYAASQKITVSDSEINARYDQIVSSYNKRNKIKQGIDVSFLEKIKELYGTNKADYLAQVKMDLLKEKVQYEVKMPLAQWLANAKSSGFIKINN